MSWPDPAEDLVVSVPHPWWSGGRPTRFRLRVWMNDRRTVAVATELADNQGTSITNNAEGVCRYVAARYVRPILVEHYEHASYFARGAGLPETFDVVRWRPGGPPPAWRRVTGDEVGRWLAMLEPQPGRAPIEGE
jgi:hypothetical protein